MNNIEQACNIGSLICVSASFAPVIEILQIILLVASTILTVLGLVLKIVGWIKNKKITSEDIDDAKNDIKNAKDKIDAISERLNKNE